MIPYPVGYAETLSTSHRMSTKASVLRDGAVIQDDLPVLDGSVSMSRSATVRRSCSLQVRLEDNLADLTDLLLPYGNELQIWSEVRIPAVVSQVLAVTAVGVSDVYDPVFTPTYGTAEEGTAVVDVQEDTVARFSLGVFRVANPEITDDGVPLLTVTGYDRSRAIQRARFVAPYTIPKGTNYVAAIASLVQTRLPGAQTLITPQSDELTPLLVFDAQTDPWAAINKMATALGMEAFFDSAGSFVLQPEPDPTQDPVVWSYTEGQDTLLGVKRNISDEPGYNGVVVVGESTSNAAPVRSVLWDTNALSPTFHLGPYGQVPLFYSSQFITTQKQADDAAAALFKRVVGLTQAVTVTAIPNPAQELSDTVELIRTPSGLSGRWLAEGLEMPLSPYGAMTLENRARREVDLDGAA